jgi:ribosomal protein S18 acetylase RimI-like enzyme
MTFCIRTATAEECAKLWPAVHGDHVMDTREELAEYRAEAPWRIRIGGRGQAAVLGAWHSGHSALAMRGVWCHERHVRAFVEDACERAREHGFSQVVSPLLPVDLLGEYRRSGMRIVQRIVALQGVPARLGHADPPPGVTLRPAEDADLAALVELDAACFEPFWRYDLDGLTRLMRRERMTVAEDGPGELIGYTLATVSGGTALLGRVCTAPSARRRGVGRALVADAAAWAATAGGETMTLCTQEENAASRALYRAAGFSEVPEAYAFALREA